MSVPNIEHDRVASLGQGGEPVSPATTVAVLDIGSLFSAVWRRRRSVIATALAMALLAALVALAIPPQYKATAKLLVDPAGLNVLRDDVTRGPGNADAALAEAESQIGVLRSSDIMLEVIGRTGLEDDPEFGMPEPGIVSGLLGMLGVGQEVGNRQLLALRRLGEAVDIGRQDMAYVIEISVWTKDAQKSARIANAFAEIYLEKNRAARTEFVRRSSQALAARLEDLRSKVAESSERVERYRSEHGIVDAGGLLVVDQQLQEATNELSRVRATVADLDTRYQQILDMRQRAISPENLSEALLSATIADLRSMLAVALAQVSALETTLGPSHPELLAARSNVILVENQIHAELDRIVEATRVERDRARARQDTLEARVDALKGDVLGTNSAMLGLRELVRQADSDRSIYEAFLKRSGELSEQQSVDTTNARMISQATPPLKKAWPPRTIIVLAAGILGLAIGVGQALLREQLDPRVQSAHQVWQETGVPVVAEIPRAVLNGDADLRGGRGYSQMDAFYNRMAGAPGDAARWVLFACPDDDRLSALASLSLARSAVEGGDRVLLVDADTRNGGLSRLFGKQDRPGLRELVYGGDNISTVHSVSDDNQLLLVPTGRQVSAIAEAARPWPLRKALSQRNQPVDMIVLSAGELWSSRLHRSVANAADAAIVVAVAQETHMKPLTQALESLIASGARVGGVLLVV